MKTAGSSAEIRRARWDLPGPHLSFKYIYFIPLSHNGSCPSVCDRSRAEPFTMHVKNPIFLNLSPSNLSLAVENSTEKQTRPNMSAVGFQASLLAFLEVSVFYTLGAIMSFMSYVQLKMLCLDNYLCVC